MSRLGRAVFAPLLELVDRRSLTPSQAWARDLVWNGTNAPERVDQGNANRLATVAACVSLISDVVSTLPVDVMIKWDGAPRPFNPRPRWLDEPVPNDPSVNISVHLGQVAYSLVTDGNAFVWCEPSVAAPEILVVLDPRSVEIRTAPGGRPEYVFTDATRVRRVIGPDNMIHVRRTSRPGWLRGLSVIDEAQLTLGVAMAASKHRGRFYRNGALLSTILEVPGEMSAEDAKALKESFAAAHTGENVFTTGVLTGGAKATTLGVTPEQAQFLETMQYDDVAIARLFRVPPILAGINTPGAVSYASAIEAVRAFATNTLAPLIKQIERAYQRAMPMERAYLALDMNGLLRADPEQRFNGYAIGIEKGFLTRDEVRAWEELPALVNGLGAVPTAQAQTTPLARIVAPPAPGGTIV